MTNCQHKSSFAYSMLNLPLKTVEQHIYLGVQLHHKLSWHPHVNSKTNRLLGFLQRNFNLALNLSERNATNSLFYLCISDYCSTIWDLHHQCLFTRLCSPVLQHRAAQFVLGRPWRRDNYDSVSSMLTELNWPSLELAM